MNKKETLVIIDGNSFIHRAYNAIPPLTNKDGFPTNAITGTTNMIQSIFKKQKPDKLVVAFDTRGKNFRHEMFSEYKANRSPMDDDLRVQIEPIKSIIKAWGIQTMSINGVEADDSICSLAKKAENQGYRVIIATSDKDMRQVVSENIFILDTKDIDKPNQLIGIEEVFEKNGVYPDKIVDLLSLVGDKADNVPGLNGCGEKTAVKWINEYGSVEEIIKNSDKIGGKIGEKLRENIENIRLSYKLVTIDLNVDCGVNLDDAIVSINNDELYELTTKYQLNRLRDELGLINNNADEFVAKIITDEKQSLEFIINSIKECEKLYIDIIPMESNLFILSKKKDNKYYACDFSNSNYLNVILNSNITIISNNTKDVLNCFYRITKNNKVYDLNIVDTRIINYIENGGQSKIASIYQLNEKYSNIELSPLRKKYKLDDKDPKWEKLTKEEKLQVKAEELRVAEDINLCNDKFDVEFSLLKVLSYMEVTGALVDRNKLLEHGIYLSKKITDIESEIFSIAGEKFNINSPKQVAEILFDKLEIESKNRTTAEDVLMTLAENNPIVELILKYRSLSKLKSTYVEGLTERMTEKDRVHTSYNQTVTTTGRLSSSDPNLQNIPIKTEDGRKIRESFIARDGYKIIALDYSQIELRVLAHLSKEEKLIEAFLNNKDIHKSTASEIFDVPLDKVTEEQRRNAKAINFGLIYGMSARRLAEEISVKQSVAKKYQENYFNKYKNIKPYFENELNFAKENLYIETLMKRKIPSKDVNSKNSFIKNHAELAAKNAKIQGSAAEIIKIAMVNIFNYMKENNSFEYSKLLIQVHDELVFEVRKDKIDEFGRKIKEIMENSVKLSVPLVADLGVGDNWLDAH